MPAHARLRHRASVLFGLSLFFLSFFRGTSRAHATLPHVPLYLWVCASVYVCVCVCVCDSTVVVFACVGAWKVNTCRKSRRLPRRPINSIYRLSYIERLHTCRVIFHRRLSGSIENMPEEATINCNIGLWRSRTFTFGGFVCLDLLFRLFAYGRLLFIKIGKLKISPSEWNENFSRNERRKLKSVVISTNDLPFTTWMFQNLFTAHMKHSPGKYSFMRSSNSVKK